MIESPGRQERSRSSDQRSKPLDEFEYADLKELLALISRLTEFLHPGTSHSEPGDEDALKWAQRILNRYRPAA